MNLSHRMRTVAATALLTVAASSAALAMAGSSLAQTKAPRAVQCRINFQASSLNLGIGQDLVLSWTAVGATKLTASWTTGFVPFVGAVTTTMTKAGTYSYQVTGTSNGLYCGGAGVEVKFTGNATQTSSSAPAPAPSTASRTVQVTVSPSRSSDLTTGTSSNGGGNGPTSDANNGSTTAGGVGGYTANRSASGSTGSNGYPVQSPTGGSGVPWYQDPIDLLAVSALALMGSLLLWRREQLRAVFARRH